MKEGIPSLAFVYLVWGSSFLAIRLAVTGDGAFPPYLLAAIRTGTAGICLLGWAALRGHSLRVSAARLRELVLTGVLLWVGGHALIVWAEASVESGLAALLFASTPLWGAILETFRDRRPPEWRRMGSVLGGFLGVALVLPTEHAQLGGEALRGGAAVLAAGFFWALGSLLGGKIARALPLPVSTGYQLLAAGVVTMVIALAVGEPWPRPGPRAVAACLYLILFATLLAYAAYAHALTLLPLRWVMSFAYVNPVIAVLLGVLVLGERLGPRSLLGMGIVVGSIIFLFSEGERNE